MYMMLLPLKTSFVITVTGEIYVYILCEPI